MKYSLGTHSLTSPGCYFVELNKGEENVEAINFFPSLSSHLNF